LFSNEWIKNYLAAFIKKIENKSSLRIIFSLKMVLAKNFFCVFLKMIDENILGCKKKNGNERGIGVVQTEKFI